MDASDCGAGAVLLQEDEHGVEHPYCYFSKTFTIHQKLYSTTEKEALSLAHQHFEVYMAVILLLKSKSNIVFSPKKYVQIGQPQNLAHCEI